MRLLLKLLQLLLLMVDEVLEQEEALVVRENLSKDEKISDEERE